jgi:hypothetical protein
MIKEIKEISEMVIALNNNIYGALLSEKEVYFLKKNMYEIVSIQKNMHEILTSASCIAMIEKDRLVIILTEINELLSDLIIATESIAMVVNKFVCNYRNEYESFQSNRA